MCCKPEPEQQVEHLLVLLDRVVGQLGQLVVAEDEMDPIGELDLQPGDVFEHRVRHAAAVLRIGRPAVADLLKDQVPLADAGPAPPGADQVEVAAVPVQVAGDHDLVGQFGRKHDQVALPAGRRA